MENGQKADIPLDSGLDIKSSDMLVPVTQPKFQHNRQKYQGHYLPSSVRFEHDGWAAGNDVYEFELNEVSVKAGEFIITKQNINKNPTYRLIVKDAEGRQAGSVYYNPSSRIVNATVGDVSVTDGVNPVITGKVNGKSFTLRYDSVKGTFSGGNTGSVRVETDLRSSYMFAISVKDTSATINISFGGMQLPTDVLQSTDIDTVYTLGRFSIYTRDDAESDWESGSYIFRLTDNNDFIIISHDVELYRVRLSVDRNTGWASGSFTVPLTYSDTPSVTLQNFIPFFSNIAATANSNSVQSSAPSELEINTHQFNIEDTDNNSTSNMTNHDKLYYNIRQPAGVGPVRRKNEQTLEQTLPVWFGVTTHSGSDFIISTDGLEQSRPDGDVIARYDFPKGNDDYIGVVDRVTNEFGEVPDPEGWFTTLPIGTIYEDTQIPDTEIEAAEFLQMKKDAYISAVIGNTLKAYFGTVVRPNVQIWEGTEDKAAWYMKRNTLEGVAYAFSMEIEYGKLKITRGGERPIIGKAHIIRAEVVKTSMQFTLSLGYNYFFNNSMPINRWDIFSCNYKNRVTYIYKLPESGRIEQYLDDTEVTIDIAESPFIDPTVDRNKQCIKFMSKTGRITYTPPLRGVIGLSGDRKVKYQDNFVKYHAYNTQDPEANYGEGDDSKAGSVHFWGRCCRGKIRSKISIASTDELTTSLNASSFSVNYASIRKEDYGVFVDVGSMFGHSLVQASCQDSLTLNIYVVSKQTLQYMFYLPELPADNTLLIMPGHIMNGTIKKVQSSDYGNLNSFAVNKSYTGTNVDTNYGLSINVTGMPVKVSDGSSFNHVASLVSTFNFDTLIRGNYFFDKVADLIQAGTKWTVEPWYGWVDISVNSPNDYDFFKDYGQKFYMDVDVNGVQSRITFTYSLKGALPAKSGNTITVTDGSHTYNISVDIKQQSSGGTAGSEEGETILPVQSMQLLYKTNANYKVGFYKPFLLDSGYRLESFQDNVAVVTRNSDSARLTIDFDTMQVELELYDRITGEYWPKQECDETWGQNNSVQLLSEYIRTVNAVLTGVYNPKNVTVNSLTANNMNITVDGRTVDVDVASLVNSDVKSSMDFLFTAVNRPELVRTKIANMLIDDEFQLLKQQWDTTNATENFWWLSDRYVLALTKSELIVREKTDTLHDWDGDVFEDVLRIDRSTVIDSSVLRYLCSCAYGGQHARFITASDVDGVIGIVVYDFLDGNGNVLKKPSKRSFKLAITSHAIVNTGEVMCPDNKSLHTYSDLVTGNVITQAKWSATCIEDDLIIGIHYDCNMNQWAVITGADAGSPRVIQGYGFVGADGSLTGGEIPAKYFNVSRGFTGAVLPLSVLSNTARDVQTLSELFNVEERIVGTDAQQWYISKNIPSIVSHIVYSNGTFVPKELKLNNNYAVNYDSGSFMSTVFSDYSLKMKAMRDLLPQSNGVWTAMLVLWTYPQLFFLDPKISVANYLQQTLGQAAYVHYNSTSREEVDKTKESVTYSPFDNNGADADVSSDEITFDRQSVKQAQSSSDPYTSTFTMFAASLVSALDWGQEKLQVNKNQNQTAASDKGRKYANNFIQNINSMAAADMSLQSISPSQTSEVTAVKSLDMFYSTSDRQQVQAGPGFVNHNFVAQCVSQSVTSVQSEMSQQKLLYLITGLTMLPLQQLNKVLVSAREAMGKSLEAVKGPAVTGAGVVVIVTPTSIAAIALAVAWIALDIACNVTQIGLELLPQMLSALGGNKLTSSITARQSKHGYDVEGKHKYGSRSECFMWPCFGIDTAQSITDEAVDVISQNKKWKMSIPNKSPRSKIDNGQPVMVTSKPSKSVLEQFTGDVDYFIAMIKGRHSTVTLPEDMAYVLGADSFLPDTDYKNENIGESDPVFPTPPFQDYIIDKSWQVACTAAIGMTTWVSVKDTKVIDGELSNCVISDEFCGLAAPYAAIEVKRGIQAQYVRPWAITPQVLAFNNTGMNCCFEEKVYHAFDGYGYRVVNWTGSPGMNKEHQTWLYAFLVNDRFKRGNKMPQNEYLGNFKGDPAMAIEGDYNDKVFVMVTQPGTGKGLEAGTVGEDKDVRRYSVPVFSEFVNTLPAAVRTVSAMTLAVVDGITSLVTENRDLQTAYKAPVSVDFTIGKNKYRFTQEYICALKTEQGVTVLEELVPCLGLEFIGSTPYEAYLYSQATRQYYVFSGGSSLQTAGMIERFRDVINGRYDFVNQEVLLPCVATFDRLDRDVHDDADETDNVMVPRLKDNSFIGEVYPPLDTIYNTRSGFRTLSLPCGVAYQGPNRCIINRFVMQDYMAMQIRSNYGLWKRVPRERYHPFRKYLAKYETVDMPVGGEVKVKGWTHNPFLLVTSPLGVDENVDCMFEWNLTFCWPVEMDGLYGPDNYAVVNVQAETMTPGGKVIAERPVHIYLKKDLFTRTGNYGYYSFRYQSKCGAGNRERLHIWSDQYICLSSLQCEYKTVTEKRTEILTEQLDVQGMKEI